MSDPIDDREVVWVTVPLDAATAARLENLANCCHSPPTSVAASLLHDVLKDDEEAELAGTTHAGNASIN